MYHREGASGALLDEELRNSDVNAVGEFVCGSAARYYVQFRAFSAMMMLCTFWTGSLGPETCTPEIGRIVFAPPLP